MANNLTDNAENRILDHINLVTAWTPTSPLKLALYTAAPGEAGGGTEVSASGTAYARTNITFAAAASGATTNNADVTFAQATASWGSVAHFAIFDSAGTPVMIWYGSFTLAKTVDTGDTFRVQSGQLALSLN